MKAGIVAVFSKRRERYLPIYLEKIKKYLEGTTLMAHHANWTVGLDNKLKLLKFVKDRFTK